jgi:N-acetylneuraminic acid mutarotase
MPGPRSEVGAALIDGKVYVAGGRLEDDKAMDRLEIYDAATDSWMQGPAMPGKRDHAGVAAVNGKLYVLGGNGPDNSLGAQSPKDTVFEFDPATSAWSTKSPMPAPRAAFAVAVVGTKIHCIGGITGKVHEAYDVVTDTWETLPAMPTGREHTAAVTLGGTIYVVGGRFASMSSPFNNVAALEAYDTETRTWTKLPPMPTKRGGLGAAVLDGKLYAIGGEYPQVHDDVEEYDPATQTWRQMKGMLTPRHGVATVAWNGWVHVIGGGKKLGGGVSAAHEAFKPE